MQITQSVLVASTILAIAAGISRADVVASAETKHAAVLEPNRIDIRTVPLECRQYLAVTSDSTSELLVWDQRLSLAACEQATAVATPAINDPEKLRELVAHLAQSVQPSSFIYRDAMARGPAEIRILAAYGLGMTSVNIMVRARNAIPVSLELDKYLALHAALEPLIAGYARDAVSAFTEVDRLAAQYPADASANAVVQKIVARARSGLH